MRSEQVDRRKFGALLIFLAVCFAIIWSANPRGYRARIVARLLRTENWPVVVSPPAGFLPQVTPGFEISVLATGFDDPRWLAIAPDGDLFVADSAAGKVDVLHFTPNTKTIGSREVFAEHLTLPFGIAFHDDYVYVANTNQVVRFRYDPNTSRRLGDAEHILDLPGFGYNQHWTRSLTFSPDGAKLFVSVGSKTNVSIESDPRRAAILVSDPDGKNCRVYANGLRNAVGIAFDAESGSLWASVNERDDIGDDLPSDYFTHVIENGFYGWPYSYLGQHVDNRVASRPDMVARAITPDVLLGAHVAALQFSFYESRQFPEAYWHGAFIAEHGSWNRHSRSGYQVVFIPFHDGHPVGAPAPFLRGLVPDPNGRVVYGRPVGVATAADGSLLISDDGQKLIWRVSYGAPPTHAR